jgi:DNA-binding LacI/PurR family transcriptional regulator
MFATRDRPDAVFVANDYMAFMVMDVLRFELGLRVPEDVAVVGFDDVPTAGFPAYDLTTMRQDSAAMVAATVAALMTEIRGTRAEAPHPLPVSLVVRGSTGG